MQNCIMMPYELINEPDVACDQGKMVMNILSPSVAPVSAIPRMQDICLPADIPCRNYQIQRQTTQDEAAFSVVAATGNFQYGG